VDNEAVPPPVVADEAVFLLQAAKDNNKVHMVNPKTTLFISISFMY
jgi:hypothetical protein